MLAGDSRDEIDALEERVHLDTILSRQRERVSSLTRHAELVSSAFASRDQQLGDHSTRAVAWKTLRLGRRSRRGHAAARLHVAPLRAPRWARRRRSGAPHRAALLCSALALPVSFSCAGAAAARRAALPRRRPVLSPRRFFLRGGFPLAPHAPAAHGTRRRRRQPPGQLARGLVKGLRTRLAGRCLARRHAGDAARSQGSSGAFSDRVVCVLATEPVC